MISQIRPLFPETVINIVGSGGTSHTSKDGPTCSGMFPATPNELGHQAIYPLAFKSLSVCHKRTCIPNYTKCSRQQNKNINVKREIMWTTGICAGSGKEREVKQLHMCSSQTS